MLENIIRGGGVRNMFKFELGLEAKDKVTGFKGIITGRCEYLYGCAQYGLVPKVSKEGKRQGIEYFDEGRIEITGRGILPKEVKVKKPGAEINLDSPEK